VIRPHDGDAARPAGLQLLALKIHDLRLDLEIDGEGREMAQVRGHALQDLSRIRVNRRLAPDLRPRETKRQHNAHNE
jgi:hypothetical protein